MHALKLGRPEESSRNTCWSRGVRVPVAPGNVVGVDVAGSVVGVDGVGPVVPLPVDGMVDGGVAEVVVTDVVGVAQPPPPALPVAVPEAPEPAKQPSVVVVVCANVPCDSSAVAELVAGGTVVVVVAGAVLGGASASVVGVSGASAEVAGGTAVVVVAAASMDVACVESTSAARMASTFAAIVDSASAARVEAGVSTAPADPVRVRAVTSGTRTSRRNPYRVLPPRVSCVHVRYPASIRTPFRLR